MDTTFAAGDVIRYTPASFFRRDGIAIFSEGWHGLGVRDVYPNSGPLSVEELATAEGWFSLNEYTESAFLNPDEYDARDIITIHAHAGMQHRHFLRNGAEPLTPAQHNDLLAAHLARALTLMLTPVEHFHVTSRPLPTECADASVLQRMQRADSNYRFQINNLARTLSRTDTGTPSRATIAVVDDAHYELYRAWRAYDRLAV